MASRSLNKYSKKTGLDAKLCFWITQTLFLEVGSMDGWTKCYWFRPEEIEVRDTVVPVDDKKTLVY